MQGLILLNKPAGITSAGAVARIRRITGEKRVGHTGTLDPMATGVLPVLLGRATALSGLMLDADKRYTAGIKLGVSTDTEDITGSIVSEKPVTVTAAETEAALKAFTGKISQRPPVYSALKKDGVRLYELARRGEMPEPKCREVEIFSLSLVSAPDRDNVFTVDAHVSKGTYIRSLGRDIALRLSSRAHLSALRRLRIGPWHLADSMKSTDELLSMTNLFSEMILNPSCRRLIDNGFIPDNAIIVDSDSSMPYAKLLIDGRVYGYGDKSSGRLKVIARCPWM